MACVICGDLFATKICNECKEPEPVVSYSYEELAKLTKVARIKIRERSREWYRAYKEKHGISYHKADRSVKPKIYVISNPMWPGAVKIGKTTTSMKRRLANYNHAIPNWAPKFEVLAIIPVPADKIDEIESELHFVLAYVFDQPRAEWYPIPWEKLEPFVTRFIEENVQRVRSEAH